MLKPDSHGKSLGFDLDATVGKVAIDIAGGMAGGKYDRTAEYPLLATIDSNGLYSHNGVAINEEAGHAGQVVNLASATYDCVAHVLDDTGKTVGAYMGMGITEYIHRCAVLAEHIPNFINIAALLAAGVELAVGVGSRPTLAKAVVALGIDFLCLGDKGQVALAGMDILATLDNDRAETMLNETEGCEQSARSLANNYHTRC